MTRRRSPEGDLDSPPSTCRDPRGARVAWTGYHAPCVPRPTLALLRQLRTKDRLALREAARSGRSETLAPRTRDADRVAKSICPYCAVGCGQRVYVKDEKVIQIEGDPD